MVVIADYVDSTKTLLDIDTDLMDEKIELLVTAAMSKLRTEGIDVDLLPEGDLFFANDYKVCVAHQVAKDLDLDVNIGRLESQYQQRVIELKAAMPRV